MILLSEGVRIINNAVKLQNGKKEFRKRIKSEAEDVLFWVIERLPQKFVPGYVMDWVNRYIDKRMRELQQEQIQANWKKVYVEKVIRDMGGN